ncbi:hypothetical protein Y032_0115g478 [Ancylostoma ceylanicum]|uniref:Uncharacterized protein n=1 Tax=Ancylostoma ceylanicum TaxID=53326 RepID=A0A016TCQ3_9BILA|nr:hypothetical protein Y032_0115g478 [Ancylostoma ceylanicum]
MRMRRTLELSKAQELNDGEVKPVEKRPTQEQYQVKTTISMLHLSLDLYVVIRQTCSPTCVAGKQRTSLK